MGHILLGITRSQRPIGMSSTRAERSSRMGLYDWNGSMPWDAQVSSQQHQWCRRSMAYP